MKKLTLWGLLFLLVILTPCLTFSNSLPIYYDRVISASVNKGYLDKDHNVILYSNVFAKLEINHTYEIKVYSKIPNSCSLFRIEPDLSAIIIKNFSDYVSFTPSINAVYGVTCVPQETELTDYILIVVERLH